MAHCNKKDVLIVGGVGCEPFVLVFPCVFRAPVLFVVVLN
jgi:hypothetical protein